MHRYLVRFALAAVLLGVAAIAFVLSKHTPGDVGHAATDTSPAVNSRAPQDNGNAAGEEPVDAIERATDAAVKNAVDAPRQIGDRSSAPSLSHAIDGWRADEEKRIAVIAGESFDQTLDAAGGFAQNYFTMTTECDGTPTTPESLLFIIYSRRFAKLLDDSKGGLSPAQTAIVSKRIRSDIEHWHRLSASGQSFRRSEIITGGPQYKTEDLLYQIGYRINAGVLLAGECAARECLPAALEAVDALGADANLSAGAYACDKILSLTDYEAMDWRQVAVAKKYLAWKGTVRENAFASYESVKVPSFMSKARPFDRATAMGLPVDSSQGEITIEVPPVFKLWKESQGSDEAVWKDYTECSGVALLIIDFARKFEAAGSAASPGESQGPNK